MSQRTILKVGLRKDVSRGDTFDHYLQGSDITNTVNILWKHLGVPVAFDEVEGVFYLDATNADASIQSLIEAFDEIIGVTDNYPNVPLNEALVVTLVTEAEADALVKG